MPITSASGHRASPVSTTEDLDTLPQSIDDLDWDTSAITTLTYAPRMERAADHFRERVPTGEGWQEAMIAFLRPTAIQPIGSSLRKGRCTRQGGELVPLAAKACAPGVLAYALPRGVKRGDEGMRALDSWRWLPLDIDKAALPVSDAWEIVEDALSDHKMASYSTWSCRDGQASIRILIPLSRAATFDEVCSLWWWARRRLADAGLPDGDYSGTAPALDPRLDSRLFYLPAVPRTGTIGDEGWGGVQPSGFISDDHVPLLQVDAVLVEARECEAVDRPAFAERWPRVPLPGGSRRGTGGSASSSKAWTGSGSGGSGATHTEWCDFDTVVFEGTTLKAWALAHVRPGTWTSIGSPWREDGGDGARGKSMSLHVESDGRVWGKDFKTDLLHRHCVGLSFTLTPWTTLKTSDLSTEKIVELLADDEDITTEAVSQEEVDRLEARRLRAEDDRRRAQEADRREREEDAAQDLKTSKIDEVRAVVDAGDEADDLERRRRLEAYGGGGLPHAVAQSLDEEEYADSQVDVRLYDTEEVYHTSVHRDTIKQISEADFSTIERVVAELDQEERVGCSRGPSVHVASRSRGDIVSSTTSCYAFTCPRCGPRLLRPTKAAGRMIFEPFAHWPVYLLRFRGDLPRSLENALSTWRSRSPEDRIYVGASTSRGWIDLLVAWNPSPSIPKPAVKVGEVVKKVVKTGKLKPPKEPQVVTHEPVPTKTAWVPGPDGVEVPVLSGALYDALKLGERLDCGLSTAYGEMIDRVDIRAWQEQTGARACILRGPTDVTKSIRDLRDGGLRRLSRSSRKAPPTAPVKKNGELLEKQADGSFLKGGVYYATYSSTARMLEAARKTHFDVVPLDFQSDAGGTTVTWGQDLSKTSPDDVIPPDIILESASQESGAVVLVRKKRSAYARLERTLDDLWDDEGHSTFSVNLKVKPFRVKREGEQIPSPKRYVALEEPVRPVAPEPAYKSVWGAFLGWKVVIFPGYDRLVLDEEGGASEDAPCSVTDWADQRPSQRLAVVIREGGVGHLLLAWEEPQYAVSQVDQWFQSSVSRTHQPPRWWDDVIDQIGERYDSVETLFQTRFKTMGESKTA